MEILSSSIWQFVAVVIAIIALFLSIWIYRKQRSFKEISYEVISNTPVVSLEEEDQSKVQVLYEGKLIRNPSLIVLRVWNSGNNEILPNDHIEPIELDFGSKAEVLSAKVLETIPSDINPSITIESGEVRLAPLLLNKGDSIKLKVILNRLNGVGEKISVHGRIAGVKQISRVISSQQPSGPETRWRAYLQLLATIIATVILALGVNIATTSPIKFIGWAMIGIGIVLEITAFFIGLPVSEKLSLK